MANVDKDIEGLIVRSLDETLSEDEELRLNRELVRNPDAQRMMEQYRSIDELAGAALHNALDRNDLPLDPELLPSRAAMASVPRRHSGWWLVPGAIAAALLALVVARFPITPPTHSTVAEVGNGNSELVPTIIPPQTIPPDRNQQGGIMRNADMGTSAPRIRREKGRDVIGVIGDNGNIYWIEVDRIQTIRWPGSGAASQSAPGEM